MRTTAITHLYVALTLVITFLILGGPITPGQAATANDAPDGYEATHSLATLTATMLENVRLAMSQHTAIIGEVANTGARSFVQSIRANWRETPTPAPRATLTRISTSRPASAPTLPPTLVHTYLPTVLKHHSFIVEPPSATPTSEPTSLPRPTATPTAPLPPAKSLRMNSPEYGMQAFPWWRPEVASRDLRIIREAGFGWCKVNFGWRDVEGAAKGAFDWSHTDPIVEMANRQNLDLLVRIDHQPAWSGGGFPTNGPPDDLRNLADFLTALVGRYRGRIRAYQVWNEPNLAREWGGRLPNPARYIEMLRVAYAAIKAADPNAMVISAGLAPTGTWNEVARPDDWYLERMYLAMGGDSSGCFDVLGAHAPGYKSPPEISPAEAAANQDLGGHRAFCFRRVEDLRAIMERYGDADKQVALVEFGWTSDPRPYSPYYWHRVSEELKAEYLVRAYRYAKEHWSDWIGLMSLIYVCDPDWTEGHEQYWWAITYPSWPEFRPRPAYVAVKAMSK